MTSERGVGAPLLQGQGQLQYRSTLGGAESLESGVTATSDVKDDLPEERDVEEFEPEGGTYATLLILALKDLQRIASGSKYVEIRATRVFLAMLLLYANIAVQVFLLAQIKTFVTSPYVRKIRRNYNTYEDVMYDGHVTDTGYGFSVGIGGKDGPYFKEENFAKLSDNTRDNICTVPFSQFNFLFVILFIWTLSVVSELKVCYRHMRWLIVRPSLDSIEDSLVWRDKEDQEVITGTTLGMKFIITLTVLLPRFLVAVILLWLGCRWLAATMDFDDMLVNAMALTFIKELNGLLYDQLMSERNKREVTEAMIDIGHQKPQAPNFSSFLSTFGWGLLSAAWVYLYITQFQMVLPGYRWDVNGPCKPYVSKEYNFWRK